MDKINLLAIILVTSSMSGGSNLVFRYPPNPQTAERLSRPVYGKRGVQDGGFSIASKADRHMNTVAIETGLSDAAHWVYRNKKGEAYDSEDSLDDQYTSALWQPLHVTGSEVEPVRQRRQAPRRPEIPAPAASTSNNPDLTSNQVKQSSSGNSFNLQDWETILGYDRDFLNSILTPSRVSCNKRFELVIDDLAFIGHPVCADESGKWVMPYEDDETEKEPERGRGRELDRPSSRNMRRFGQTPQELTPVNEHSSLDDASIHSSTSTYVSDDTPHNTSNSAGEQGQPSSQLSFFHLVLVLDKPDPELDYDSPGTVYEMLWREVAFKWTAAAFDQQIKSDWVGKECLKLSKIRENATSQLIPLKQAQTEAFATSPLAKSLRELYDGLRDMIPIQLTVGEIPIDIALPIPHPRIAEEWTRWGDESEISESESDLSDLDLLHADDMESITTEEENDDNEVIVRPTNFRRDPAFDFKPWKTLLPLEFIHNLREPPAELDDEALLRYRQISQSSMEVSEFVRRFLQSLDPTVPLYEIAAYLEMDLESEVYPLARYLIQIRKVKLIDVVRKSLRNVFIPESTTGKSIPIICAGWAKEFPSLPSWPTFISRISAAPQPYRRLIPQFNGEIVLSDREEYTRALYWLISHDLVVQAHDHVKIVATKATKQKARKELDRERTLKRLAKERDPTGRRASVPESLMGDRSKVANETESIVETASTDDSLDISEEDFDESKLGEEFLNDPQESFIHKPKKPSSAENRCLKIIMRDKDLEWQRRFAQCLTCFDGKMTLDAMQYETGLRRNYIRDLLTVFKEDLVVFLHP